MNGQLFASRRVALVPTVLAVGALLAALAVALLSATPAAAQDEVVIDIVDFTFDPGSLEIEAGTTVTWVNNDDVSHTATGDGGEFDTGTIDSGGSASITFDEAASYTYHCEIHPNMTASLVVTGGSDDSGDDTDTGGTTSSNLPSSGAGTAFRPGESNTLSLALLLLAAALGSTGLLVWRRAA